MPEPGPEAFVADLWPALHQSAAIAEALQGRVPNRPKSGEHSAVKAALTVADTAAQEALLIPLLRRFADVHLEAEEDTESVKRFTGRRDARVVIDPIDGTLRSYLEAEGPYAVMAGLSFGGRFRAAVLALPREKLFFRAIEGQGAWMARGDAPARRARARGEGDVVMVSYDLPAPIEAHIVACGYRIARGCGGAVAIAPLLPGVVGGLRVPTPPPLSLRGRIGLLVSAEAGAVAVTPDGPAPADLGRPLPSVVVAARPEVREDLVRALRAAD